MSPTKPITKQSPNESYIPNDDTARFPCPHCKNKYAQKALRAHEAKCVSSRTCPWCKIVFRNRGNLASHTKHLHQNKEIRNIRDGTVSCDVCNNTFSNDLYLKYHIRRDHYNLKTKIALRNGKTINQVWFERVINTNVIVEMSKREHNRLLIQKYGKDVDGIEIDEEYEEIDLSNVYPLQAVRIKCEICNKSVVKKSYKKHLDEKHGKAGKKHCTNCNKSFKRLYFYVKHVCNKTKVRKRIVIDKVESLHPIML